MANYHVDDIRTVALVGHEVAGKTSICDALLFKAKASDRRGCVDEGTSVSDYDDEEKKTKYSIDSSVLYFDHHGKRVYLIDTPGKPEFIGQAIGALDAVDLAVIVISVSAGVQVNTRRMFSEAARREIARVIVINKLDGDNIHFDELLKVIRQSLGKNCVLFNAPDAVGLGFKSVVDELHAGTKPTGTPVDLSQERALLVDAIVESDEALMEKFLSTGEVTDAELEKALPHAIVSGAVVPILCTAAKKDKDIGIAELLDFLVDDAPSPKEGRHRKATVGTNGQTKEMDITPDEKADVVGQVFKTHNDTFVGHLCYFRIYAGTLSTEQPLFIARAGKSVRGGGLMLVQGKTTKPINQAIPGDIVAIAKVDDLHIGDTINLHAGAPVMPKPSFPAPMFGLAIEPKARGDEQKISGSLQKIADEDPTFKVTRDTQTKELVITGMSQLHLDIVQKRLKARFGLEVVAHEPKIAYRETINAPAEANYRHKKQSGGRGQPIMTCRTTRSKTIAWFGNGAPAPNK